MSDLTLIIKELDNAAIRKTDTRKYSIYDVIRIQGAKNPWETLERIDKAYPDDDILTKCEFVKFKMADGRLQAKLTPVADAAHTLKIIGLCPGMIGRAYRDLAANTVKRYIEADVSLAADIVERSTDIKALQELLETLKQTIERQQEQIGRLEQTVNHQRQVIAESSALKTKEDLIAEIQEYCQAECRSQPPSFDKNRMADISVRAAYLLDWLNGAIPTAATLDDIFMLWARLKQCGNRLKEFTTTTPAAFVFDTMKPYDDLINKFEQRRWNPSKINRSLK